MDLEAFFSCFGDPFFLFPFPSGSRPFSSVTLKPLPLWIVSLVTFVLSSSSYLIDRDSFSRTFLVVDVGKIGTTAVMYYWLSTFDVGDTGTYLFPGIGVVLGLFVIMLVFEIKRVPSG